MNPVKGIALRKSNTCILTCEKSIYYATGIDSNGGIKIKRIPKIKAAYLNLIPTVSNISVTGMLGVLIYTIYYSIGIGINHMPQQWS